MSANVLTTFPHSGDSKLEDFVGYFAVASKVQSKNSESLGRTKELAIEMADVLDGLVLELIRLRTADQFSAMREEVFPVYLNSVKALHSIIHRFVSRPTREAIQGSSLSEIESTIREKATAAFGQVIAEQAEFTTWTFRRISGLASRLSELPLAPESTSEQDRNLLASFILHSVWADLHLNCLLKAIEVDQPLHPEVVAEVSEGMRAAVDAYGIIREAFDLRVQPETDLMPPPDDDEEDEALVRESMLDMVHEQDS